MPIYSYRHLSEGDEIEVRADVVHHLPSVDIDLLVLVAYAFLNLM